MCLRMRCLDLFLALINFAGWQDLLVKRQLVFSLPSLRSSQTLILPPSLPPSLPPLPTSPRNSSA